VDKGGFLAVTVLDGDVHLSTSLITVNAANECVCIFCCAYGVGEIRNYLATQGDRNGVSRKHMRAVRRES
jgi:hypothetical protein